MAQQRNYQLAVQGAEAAIDAMKTEIAGGYGIQLGPETSSRNNGSVGGEITKRLVRTAQQQMGGGR